MKILVSKPDALGDQVFAASFVQALRRRWPEARIVWHVRTGMEVIATVVPNAAIFHLDPAADPIAEAGCLWAETTAPIVVVPYAIHPFTDWAPGLDERFQWWGRFLAASPWDLAVAPVVNRTGLTDFTVTASRAAQRVAFAVNSACQPLLEAAFTHLPEKRADFTLEVPSSLQEPEWTQQARLLAAIAPGESLLPPQFSPSPVAAGEAGEPPGSATRLALLAPAVGQNPQRAWPLARFLQLAQDLRARGCEVRWLEGPHDTAFFAALPAAEAPSRLTLEAARLDQLVAVLRRSALLVCNDTAYVHLAAAVDTPTVAIFGAGQKDRFLPRFGRVRVVQGDPVCRGCQWQCAFDRFVCTQDVPYAAVLAAIKAQLAAPTAAHARLDLPLPFDPPAPDTLSELGRVRDWYQEELNRLRWDGWARLQIINDVLQRLSARDQRIAGLMGTAHASLPLDPAPHGAGHDDRGGPARERRDPRAQAAPPDVALRVSAGISPSSRPAAPASSSALPRLSVIIPMGRPERADGTLRSLAGQTLRPAAWEVVVVGVGASQLLAKYPGLPLVPVDLEHNLLPPRTRVEGVRRATGEWFIFVDDDVQLAPDYFEMLARALAVAPSPPATPPLPVGALGGRLPGGRGTYFERLTDISNFWSQQSPIRAVPHTVWFLYSAAIVVRAEAYHKAGGFNPELPNGEDVDLTQRIKAAGYILAYEPSLVAYHHHGRDSLFRMWRYFWRNGNAARYFFAQHGGVCCYSVRTVLTRTWLDLRMNRRYQRTQGVRLGLRVPWILLNYLIVESSLEWHYQEYLFASRSYATLPARSPSDRNAVLAFTAFAAGRRLRGAVRYALAMLQNLTDPVRR